MDQEKDSKRYITPGGAGLAAICFFLPWVRGCGQDISGVQIASNGGSELWIVLLSALAIVGAFIVFDGKNALNKLKPVVLIGGILSLLILVVDFVQIKNKGAGMMEIQYGWIMTGLGFIASLFGLSFVADSGDVEKLSYAVQEIMPPESWYCSCGHQNYPCSITCQGCLKPRTSLT